MMDYNKKKNKNYHNMSLGKTQEFRMHKLNYLHKSKTIK